MNQEDKQLTEEEIIEKCGLSPNVVKLLRDMGEETYKEIAKEVIFLARPIIVVQTLKDVGERLTAMTDGATHWQKVFNDMVEIMEALKQGKMPRGSVK